MVNKLRMQIRKYEMVAPGDKVICAVSGGADSMALLWCLYLLREKLEIAVEAAHFNHGLRGEESLRDQKFVENFCRDYQIPLHVGVGQVVAGKKGLEAAAREARYAFFESLSGKIATAHTANDNAETVLLHLVRGTGLKGLGGISPVRGNVIRPMLTVTRQEVVEFLQSYHIPWVEDSSNGEDKFLRNRLRHNVMPLLQNENPKIAENLSQMAMELRFDEAALQLAEKNPTVSQLRQMHDSRRRRALGDFLKKSGVNEPERAHISLLEQLVFSDKPSAKADFPGGVCICRNYEQLQCMKSATSIVSREIPLKGITEIPELGIRISTEPEEKLQMQMDAFTVKPCGTMVLRGRMPGDCANLSGGTKSLKKWMIDKKIPATQRDGIPILADDVGVLAVIGYGLNKNRLQSGVIIKIEKL